MTSIPAQPSVRAEWARDHGIDGADGAEFDDDLAVDRARARGPGTAERAGRRTRPSCAARQPWAGRPARPGANGVGCGDCGSCPFGCRRGAKQGGLRVHLADAWRHGARIVPDARVERVLIDGGRASGVVARLADGRSLTIRAPQVVSRRARCGRPGSSSGAGSGTRRSGGTCASIRCRSIGAFMRDAVDDVVGDDAGGPFARVPRAARAGRHRASSSSRRPAIRGSSAWRSRGSRPTASRQIMTRVRRIAPLIAIVRDTGPGGRVRSTGSGGVRIDYPVGPAEIATLRRGLVEMARLGRAAGAGDMVALGTPPAWYRPGAISGRRGAGLRAAICDRLASFDFGPNRGMVFSAHQMGTARMGGDPADHPVDERGRVRADAPRHDRAADSTWATARSSRPRSGSTR